MTIGLVDVFVDDQDHRLTRRGSRHEWTQRPRRWIRFAAPSSDSPPTQDVPLFVFDAGYDAIAVGHDLTNVCCAVLCVRDPSVR
jgi:hypothetical protein